MLLGRDGAGYDALCAELATFRGTKSEVRLEQLARPELEPLLVADDVALKLSRGRAPRELLEIIAQQGLKLEERPFTMEEAYQAREAFITSATQFVTPVVRIDGRPVGNGAPGLIASALRRDFHDHAEVA